MCSTRKEIMSEINCFLEVFRPILKDLQVVHQVCLNKYCIILKRFYILRFIKTRSFFSSKFDNGPIVAFF